MYQADIWPQSSLPHSEFGLVAVLRLHHLVHALLGLPGLAGVAVEIDDVMARFVAVPVFADAALDVGLGLFVSDVEQLVELRGELAPCRPSAQSGRARPAARTRSIANWFLR